APLLQPNSQPRICTPDLPSQSLRQVGAEVGGWVLGTTKISTNLPPVAPDSGPRAADRSSSSPLYSAGTLAIVEDHPKVRELALGSCLLLHQPKSITAQMEIPTFSCSCSSCIVLFPIG
uniref:Uncharacterized protein n=1 Tax=Gopherus agassizii TaxID=38772 RepID=A0A452GTM9_9SAUR